MAEPSTASAATSSAQRRTIRLLLVAWTFLLLAAAYFAGNGDSSSNNASQHVTGRSIEEAMPVFKQEPRALSPDVRRIEKAFSSASEGPIANVDYSRAHPVPIEMSLATAWIAPAGDHVCAFMPDPLDGYGAGCVTVEDIELGRGFSMQNDDLQAYVLIYVLEGDAPPRIESERGSKLLNTTGNAAAVHTLTDSTISTDHGAIDLQALRTDLPAEGREG